MKLSAKIEYACKAVIELALRYNEETPVQLSVISEAQKIPKNFLLQLFLRLKSAGIVKSVRGIAGGYFLAKHPSRLTLVDVFEAVDDSIITKPKKSKSPGHIDAGALLFSIWNDISNNIAKQLNGITLESLAKQIKSEQPTYYI